MTGTAERKHNNALLTAAPAKLNLRLKIIGRRADGYHRLSMLNVTTSLCDQLELDFQGPRGVRIEMEGVPDGALASVPAAPEKNLASRAAFLFREAFGMKCGVTVRLKKSIPAGAGLGGGSSDAAAVLRALSARLRHADPIEYEGRLREIALKLGADVPFFLQGGLARVSGIGEEVAPLPAEFLRGLGAALVLPAAPSPTAAVYEMLRKTRPEIAPADDPALNAFCAKAQAVSDPAGRSSLYRELLALVENDLLEPARMVTPQIGEVMQKLGDVPGIVYGLTGSGSGIFVLPNRLESLGEDKLAEIRQALSGTSARVEPLTLLAARG